MATMMTTMMTGLLLLLLAGVTVSRVVDLDKRVYKGVPCDKDVLKYHVKLITFDANLNEFASGGSLISKQWILTAAHNVPKGETVTAILGFHPGPAQGNPVTIKDEPIRYSDPDGSGPHDIALLKLPDADHGFPIAPRTDCSKAPKITDTVQIAGIGATGLDATGKKGGPLKSTLHCGNTKVVKCEGICDTTNLIYNKNEQLICYEKTDMDASGGDSGGAVTVNDMIYGVHRSSGEYPCQISADAINICDPQYKKWINDNTHIGIE